MPLSQKIDGLPEEFANIWSPESLGADLYGGDLTMGGPEMSAQEIDSAEQTLMDYAAMEEGLNILDANTDSHFGLAEQFYTQNQPAIQAAIDATEMLPDNEKQAARTQLADTLRLTPDSDKENTLALFVDAKEQQNRDIENALLREDYANTLGAAETLPEWQQGAKKGEKEAIRAVHPAFDVLDTLISGLSPEEAVQKVEEYMDRKKNSEEEITAVDIRGYLAHKDWENDDPYHAALSSIGSEDEDIVADNMDLGEMFEEEWPDMLTVEDTQKDRLGKPFYKELYAIPGVGTLKSDEIARIKQDAEDYYYASPEGMELYAETGEEGVESGYTDWLSRYMQSPEEIRSGPEFRKTAMDIGSVLTRIEEEGFMPEQGTQEFSIDSLYNPNFSTTSNRENTARLRRLAKLYMTNGDRGEFSRKIHYSMDKYMDYLSNVEDKTEGEIFNMMLGLKRTPSTAPQLGDSTGMDAQGFRDREAQMPTAPENVFGQR